MKIEIANTIKDLTEVITDFPSVEQNQITLNSGQTIKAQHVHKVGTGLANIHVSDNHVILNVPRCDINYDKEENEKFFSKNEPPPPTSPNPHRRKSGCGGCAKNQERMRKKELEKRRQQIIRKKET